MVAATQQGREWNIYGATYRRRWHANASIYEWPGNIRELRNACENLAVLRAGKKVAAGDLDARFSQPVTTGVAVSALLSAGGNTLDRELNEKQLLKQALAAAAGNRTRAAELMGISRRTLHRKLLQWPELDPGPETA